MTIKSVIGNIINLGGLFNIIDTRSEEDIMFSKMTEDAWCEYDAGDYVTMTEEDFLCEVETW